MKPAKSLSLDLRAAAAAPDDSAPALTFGELVTAHELVLPEKQLGPRLKKWVDAFGDLNAWELTPAMLAKASHEMVKHGYAGGSVNRDIGAIGQLYRWAIKGRRIAPSGFLSPTLGVPRHAESIRRIYVSDGELKQLRFLACKTFPDKLFGLFVNMLADSGCRKSEILERRWSDLDIAGRRIVLKTSKNGDSRTLFFSPATIALAVKLKPASDGLIFPGKRGGETPINYRAPWTVLVGMVGRAGLHMHDLRHAAAASLLEQGVTIGVASQILGHRDQTMLLRRYAHLDTGHLSSVMDARFAGAVTS